jgi:surface antigen
MQAAKQSEAYNASLAGAYQSSAAGAEAATTATRDLEAELENYKKATEAAAKAQDTLWTAQQNYEAGVGGDLVALLDKAKIKGTEYTDALAAGAKELNADAIASRLNGLDRYVVPRECGTVTAFIDPGGYGGHGLA